MYNLPLPPPPYHLPPYSPSLISLMVSVDVKHHVSSETGLTYNYHVILRDNYVFTENTVDLYFVNLWEKLNEAYIPCLCRNKKHVFFCFVLFLFFLIGRNVLRYRADICFKRLFSLISGQKAPNVRDKRPLMLGTKGP